MDYTRRSMIKTGLTASVAAALTHGGTVQSQQRTTDWRPKEPGKLRITAITGEGDRERDGLRQITSRLPNADFWWAANIRPITPEMLHDTDLLLTYYSSYLYSDENVQIIIDDITNRGMAWIAVHNTPWFAGDRLCEFMGAYAMLHREIQPVIIRNLNQKHPITQGIEPFIIQLDEQFGLYLADPDDPDVTLLFKSEGVHDRHVTIQGICTQRGNGRIVVLTPGHYEWTWYETQYREIVWRAAQWALKLPMQPYYGNFDDFIW